MCDRACCKNQPKHLWTKCKNTWHRGDQYKCQDIRCKDKEWHCDDKCPFINDGPPQYEPCPVPKINKVDTDQQAQIEEIIKGLKLRENPLLSKHPDIQEETLQVGPVGRKKKLIEASYSPWASAMVAVRKSGQDRNKVRWCVDYRYLNSVTVPDSYPLPRTEDNLRKLEGCKVFSALDCNAAYHCIRVGEETKPLLSFTTPYGLFTYRRLPFNPSGGPACFARFMEMTIGSLWSPHVSVYLDDVLLSTENLRQHIKEL